MRDKDEERRNMQQTLKDFPSRPAKVPGATGKNPYAESVEGFGGVVSNAKKSVTAGDFSSPQGAGATVNASVKQGADWVNRGANTLAQVAVAPNVAAFKAVKDPVAGFAKGLVTGKPGDPAAPQGAGSDFSGVPVRGGATPNTADPSKNYVTEARNELYPAAGTPPTGAVATPERMPDRAPVNSDQAATGFLATESADRNPGTLDVNNMKPVQGLSDVGYAGRYGKTDVFGNVTTDDQGNKVGRFSDRDNLATLAGGKAAAVPEGKTAIDNNSLAGINFSGDQNKDGILDQTSPELIAARKAAMDRGDFSAVERSMMSSEERASADEAQGFKDVQAAARRRDPVNAYAQDLASDASKDQTYASLLGSQATADRNARIDARNDSKVNGDLLKQAFDMGSAQLPVDQLTGKPAPEAIGQYQSALTAVAQQYPGATPIEWSTLAMKMMRGEVDATEDESDTEAASVINSFL